MLLDKFPKAQRHGLVMPRDPALDSIYDLQREHLPLLRYMVVRVLLFVSHELCFCLKPESKCASYCRVLIGFAVSSADCPHKPRDGVELVKCGMVGMPEPSGECKTQKKKRAGMCTFLWMGPRGFELEYCRSWGGVTGRGAQMGRAAEGGRSNVAGVPSRFSCRPVSAPAPSPRHLPG
jgi:hypothetical protein